MSLVEVLPVEPVIATTLVPLAPELPPPRPRERLQARERDRGARAPPPLVRGRDGRAARARARRARPRRPPRAPRAACSPPSERSPRSPTNRSPGPAWRESMLARRGPGSLAAPWTARPRDAAPAARATRAASQPSRGLPARSTRLRPSAITRWPRGSPAGAQRLPGDGHVVEGHLAAPGQLLPLLVALAGDHQHVARAAPTRSASAIAAPRSAIERTGGASGAARVALGDRPAPPRP